MRFPLRERGVARRSILVLVLVLAVTALGVLALAACKGERVLATGGNASGSASTAPIEPTSSLPPGVPEPAQPTYWNRVAGIMEAHCTQCHAEGGIGPMPLTTFAETKVHAAAIVWQTETRHMPPWLPDTSSCSKLEHSRAMPDADIAALRRWAEGGAPEGSHADVTPPPPRSAGGAYARLPGEPDRVVRLETPYEPKRGKGTDDYHCFVLDPKITAPEMVTGLRIAPGAASIVHHVLLYEVRPSAVEKIRALDDAEPGPGYTCFGGIGILPTVRQGKPGSGELVDFDAQMIVGWAPGGGATDVPGAPTALPAGTALRLAPGSKLVMQVHYSLENHVRGMKDQTRVDMWLAKPGDVRKQAFWVPLADYRFRVPAGTGPDDPRAESHAEVTLPIPLTILGVAPHMHLRGKTIQVAATPPLFGFLPPPSAADGGTKDDACIVDVPRWDFHHQEAYWLAEGVRASKGKVTCRWDNRESAQPIRSGKRTPARELRWGEGTDDEMCLAFLYATI